MAMCTDRSSQRIPVSSLRRRFSGRGAWFSILAIYAANLLLVSLLEVIGYSHPRPTRRHGLRLLITGRFDSLNWCRAHLLPLARASCLREIIAVVDGPTFGHPKIRYCPPPWWMTRILGRAVSKAVWMVLHIPSWRPDVVMGYHIFPGALSALTISKLARARCVYQMTAGPVEVVGGGIATENPLLSRLNRPSPLLERLALQLCRHFDAVVVRGTRAREFLHSRTTPRQVEIITGSIDCSRFDTVNGRRSYDIAYVGRLMPIKQPEHFLRVIAALLPYRPNLQAAVVGSGPLMRKVQDDAGTLGLVGVVEFLGHRQDVEQILQQTKIFVLTSRSEGLSIALAEAMAAGAVPVVADVGDLADLVHNGRTGWCVPPGDFQAYAQRIHSLLEDPLLWQQFSDAARVCARNHSSIDAITTRWNRCLSSLSSPQAPARLPTPATFPVKRESCGIDVLRPYRSYRSWQKVPRWVKHRLARPIQAIPSRYWLGGSFTAHLRVAEESQYWPLERTRAFQLTHLQRICTLAYDKSPYYRQAFDAVGFSPKDLQFIDDLNALPTIDKNTLIDHLDQMCTVSPRSPGIECVSTGGTSGTPLRFYMRANRSAIEFAYLVASWQRAGYRLDTPLAVFRGRVVPENDDGLHHEYDPILRHHYYSSFHMTDENMSRYLEHVRTIGPCFLHVYPSSIAVLAGFLLRSGIRPPENIRGIIAESEVVRPEQRRTVGELFGCRYFSCYGHSEKVVLASECEFSADYHVWPTYGHFELLDEDGKPIRTPGQRGEIVGTGFMSTVVPFIRYRTGDYATYVADRCGACGRQHPVIADIRGHRTQEMLVAADRTLISWTALNMHDDTFANVRQFQFTQDTPGKAVLRIVPADGFSDTDRCRILHNLGQRLNGRLEVALRITDSIFLSPRGKAIYVDQKIKDVEDLIKGTTRQIPELVG